MANETICDKIFCGDYFDETNLKLSVIFQIEKYLWHFFEMTSDMKGSIEAKGKVNFSESYYFNCAPCTL